MDDDTFGGREVRFPSYPFRSATVYPRGAVPVERLASVDPLAAPPELRLASGEVLFVSASASTELESFAVRNRVPVLRRLDVWALLLEPFLDIELSAAAEAHAALELTACGVDADEVASVRALVGPAMVAYNFESGLWDWCHLGLHDVLSALSGELSGPDHRLPDAAFATFYWRAMRLAARGRPLD